MAELPKGLEEDDIAQGHVKNGENDEIISNGRNCLAAAQESGDKEGETDAYMILGDAHFSKGEYDDSISYSEKYFATAQECDSKVVDLKACTTMAKAHLKEKEYDDAIVYSEVCLAIAEESGDKKDEMNAYMILVEAHLSKEKYDDVILYGEKCLAIAQELGSKEDEKCAHMAIGKAYFMKGENDDAILYNKKCLAIAQESGDKNAEMNAYMMLGDTYFIKGEYDDAISYCEKRFAISQECESKVDTKACTTMAKALLKKKEYDDAIFYSQMCLAIAEECNDSRGMMNSYMIIGEAHLSKMEYDDVILYGEKCLAIAQECGDKKCEMIAYVILGEAHFGRGEHADALLMSEKCVAIAHESGDLMVKRAKMIKENVKLCKIFANTNIMNGRSFLENYVMVQEYMSIHMTDFACFRGIPLKKEYYDGLVFMINQKLTFAQELGNKEAEMLMSMFLGFIHLSNDKCSDAYYYLKVGIELAEELENENAVYLFKLFLCNIYESLGMREELFREFIEAQLNRVNNTQLKSVSSDWRKQYVQHRLKHEYEQAICCLENIISARETHVTEPPYSKWSISEMYELQNGMNPIVLNLFSKCSISEMYGLQGQYHKGIQGYQEVLDLALKIGNKHLTAKCHFGLGEIYLKLEQFKKAEDSIKESLQCLEFLFGHLGQNDQFKIAIVDKHKQSSELLFKIFVESDKKEEALLLSDHYRARALKDILVSRYEIKIESSQEKLQYTDVQALVSSRKYTLLFYSTSLVNELCTFLVQEGTQLEFSLRNFKHCDRCLHQLVHDAFEDMKVREVVSCEDRSLGAMDDFEENKNISRRKYGLWCPWPEQCHSCASRGNSSKVSDDFGRSIGSMEKLYHVIIHDVKSLIIQDEIVVIPEGSLFQVPFAALRDPDTGQYLSETKRIRLAPSINTLKLLQECPVEHHSNKDALIIGDPLVGRVMMDGKEKEFDPLRGALEEAADIALILEVCPLLAARATKPAVLEKLKQGVSIVHIAAHGSLSRAAIVLAPSPKIRATKIPDEDDYMLTMADVQQAQVRAQLVVLSCCHSGRGKIKAEGVVGMCRAFLASGARAVIGSLWAVDDRATRKFMKRFYKYLKDGRSASTSLHLTMNDMRRKPRYSEPKFWAPFFLMGDDVTITL